MIQSNSCRHLGAGESKSLFNLTNWCTMMVLEGLRRILPFSTWTWEITPWYPLNILRKSSNYRVMTSQITSWQPWMISATRLQVLCRSGLQLDLVSRNVALEAAVQSGWKDALLLHAPPESRWRWLGIPGGSPTAGWLMENPMIQCIKSWMILGYPFFWETSMFWIWPTDEMGMLAAKWWNRLSAVVSNTFFPASTTCVIHEF